MEPRINSPAFKGSPSIKVNILIVSNAISSRWKGYPEIKVKNLLSQWDRWGGDLLYVVCIELFCTNFFPCLQMLGKTRGSRVKWLRVKAYQMVKNLSRSRTRPTVSAKRCGEWGILAGRRNISPSLITTSLCTPRSTIFNTMSPALLKRMKGRISERSPSVGWRKVIRVEKSEVLDDPQHLSPSLLIRARLGREVIRGWHVPRLCHNHYNHEAIAALSINLHSDYHHHMWLITIVWQTITRSCQMGPYIVDKWNYHSIRGLFLCVFNLL